MSKEPESFREPLDYRFALVRQIDRINSTNPITDPSLYAFRVGQLETMLSPYLDSGAEYEIEEAVKQVEKAGQGYTALGDFYRNNEESQAKADLALAKAKFEALVQLMDRKGLALTGRESNQKL